MAAVLSSLEPRKFITCSISLAHHLLPANRRSEGSSNSSKSWLFLFLYSQLSIFCFPPSSPFWWCLPILSVTMALPIVRAPICTLLIPIPISISIPIFSPLNPAPRTTTIWSKPPYHKTKRSCLHNSRKKLCHG